MLRSRLDILRRISELDPARDNQEIVRLTGTYEYPFLMQRALEFALFRTYAVPSISRLLDATGQFAKYGQRRYDDTSLIIAEISENGYDSERGRLAIKTMNRIHGRFDISNDDNLYVLSTFIYEPVRWHERYGWRTPTEIEKQANFNFWCEVGRRMGIKDIPPTYEAYEAFNIAYERERFTYSETNYRVGEATIQIFLGQYPRILSPLIRQVIYAMLDEPLRAAFGFPKCSQVVFWLVDRSLKLGAKIIRFMPPRKKPFLLTQKKNRTYPDGYSIEKLGPPQHNGD